MICSKKGCSKTARKVTGICRPCYQADYRKNNAEKRAAYAKEYHKDYYLRNKEQILEKNRAWFRANPERKKELYREWCKNNPEKYKARVKRLREQNAEYYKQYNRSYGRKKRVKEATPKWVDKKQLKKIYMERPEGFHVDHVIPINGKGVCGLHVPWNLQYLPASVNIKKGNKY